MTLFDAYIGMETTAIRIDQALDLLSIIVSDMEENDVRSEEGQLLLAHRFPRYINAIGVFRRDMENIREELGNAMQDCYSAHKKDAWIAARRDLADLGTRGVDVAAIVHGMGYRQLGEVPPELLGDVVNRARQEAQASA